MNFVVHAMEEPQEREKNGKMKKIKVTYTTLIELDVVINGDSVALRSDRWATFLKNQANPSVFC